MRQLEERAIFGEIFPIGVRFRLEFNLVLEGGFVTLVDLVQTEEVF